MYVQQPEIKKCLVCPRFPSFSLQLINTNLYIGELIREPYLKFYEILREKLVRQLILLIINNEF